MARRTACHPLSPGPSPFGLGSSRPRAPRCGDGAAERDALAQGALERAQDVPRSRDGRVGGSGWNSPPIPGG